MAVTHHLRLTLDQLPIAAKSNEIPALAPLLKQVAPPPGTLITADAMHCQQESARCITQELGGDYLFGLKGNQSGILEKAQSLCSPSRVFPLWASGRRDTGGWITGAWPAWPSPRRPAACAAAGR